jgi:hypothetical protein
LATASFTSAIYGHPLSAYTKQEVGGEEEPTIDYGSPEFYEKMIVIMALVLVGGAFAGVIKRINCILIVLTEIHRSHFGFNGYG